MAMTTSRTPLELHEDRFLLDHSELDRRLRDAYRHGYEDALSHALSLLYPTVKRHPDALAALNAIAALFTARKEHHDGG